MTTAAQRLLIAMFGEDDVSRPGADEYFAALAAFVDERIVAMSLGSLYSVEYCQPIGPQQYIVTEDCE